MWWFVALGTLMGGAAGWLLALTLRGSDRRLIDELYGRKVKLAETDRDKAVRQLNANLVEMTTYAERFAAKDAELDALRGELERSQRDHASASSAAEGLRAELAEVGGRVGRALEEARSGVAAAAQAGA